MITRALCALSVLVFGMACGGRSVDLDRPAMPAGSAGAANVKPAPKTVLAERVYQFWVDDERLYWTAYLSSLKGCLTSDCEHTRLNYGTPWGAGVTIGAHDVYWLPETLPTEVLTCPRSGCVGSPRTFLHDPNNAAGVAQADGDYFYWHSSFDIYRCPSSGCAATPEVVAADETAEAFTFQGDYVYWVKYLPGDGGAGPTDEQILRAPKNGSAPPQVILPPPGNSATSMSATFSTTDSNYATDPRRIYWIDSRDHILSCPLEGCGDSVPAQLVASSVQMAQLSVDESGLYWTEPMLLSSGHVGGSLHFCAFANCASGESTVVIDKPIYEYLLNGPFIYWTQVPDDDTGYPTTIQRIAKPSGS